MKKMLRGTRRVLFLSCSAALLQAGFSQHAFAATNLLADPGFEVSDGNVDASGGDQPTATGWTTFGNAFTHAFVPPNFDGAPAHTGTQLFKTFVQFNGAYQQFAVTPGQSYTATVWGLNFSNDEEPSGTVASLELNFFTDASAHGAFFNVVPVITGGGPAAGGSPLDTWEQATITLTVPSGFSFMRFQINQTASAGGAAFYDDASLVLNSVVTTATWNGGGADNNWTTPNNWGGTAPVANLILNFGGTTRTTNNNDYAAGTQFNGLQFITGAGAFTLNGNSINLGGNVVNNSTSLQTINTPLVLLQPTTLNAATGDLALGGIISGDFGLLLNGSGAVTLSAADIYTGTTAISAGTLNLPSSASISSSSAVTIGAGATANINGRFTGAPAVSVNGNMIIGAPDAANHTPGNTLVRTWTSLTLGLNADNSAGAVSLATAADHTVLVLNGTGSSGLIFAGSTNAWSGKLDMGGNNGMVVKNGNLADITNQLKEGHGTGATLWNGPAGITSNAAANDTRHLTTLGVAQGGVPLDGVTTSATDVLVKYTYYGDANLDGILNGADYAQIDSGFGTHATDWAHGDFNYDGVVDGTDYALIDNTFNQIRATGSSPLAIIASPAAVTSSVPEPTLLGLIGIGMIGFTRRRRRVTSTEAL
jgi:autotransporter-associated beta strand protein